MTHEEACKDLYQSLSAHSYQDECTNKKMTCYPFKVESVRTLLAGYRAKKHDLDLCIDDLCAGCKRLAEAKGLDTFCVACKWGCNQKRGPEPGGEG